MIVGGAVFVLAASLQRRSREPTQAGGGGGAIEPTYVWTKAVCKNDNPQAVCDLGVALCKEQLGPLH